MDTIIAQMIDDAKATLEASLATRRNLATNDVRLLIDPVRAGERSNYRGYWLSEFDLLVVNLPHENRGCKFDLTIHTHAGAHTSQTFVVVAGGSQLLRAVNPKYEESELVEINPETVTELAAQIRCARPAP